MLCATSAASQGTLLRSALHRTAMLLAATPRASHLRVSRGCVSTASSLVTVLPIAAQSKSATTACSLDTWHETVLQRWCATCAGSPDTWRVLVPRWLQLAPSATAGLAGHIARNCPRSATMIPYMPQQQMVASNLQCRNCKQMGHFAKDCTLPSVCNICGGRGHMAAECPSDPAALQGGRTQRRYPREERMELE